MEFVLGFLVAAAVGLTGVGAGSITAPALILFFGLSPANSVGTSLIFAAAIKLALLPLYIRRRQVDYRVVGLLMLGGLPGVVAGSLLIAVLDGQRQRNVMFFLLGLTVAIMAAYNLYRLVRGSFVSANRDRSRWLPFIASGIGAEVGFSSAGAGALGSVALLSLTTLSPARVVGTDMVFGLLLAAVGGGFHLVSQNFDSGILWKLILGGLAGGFAGANLSAILPSRVLRGALSVWLISLGGRLCWKALA